MLNIVYQLKLCRAAGSIHLFKINGKLFPEHVKLNEHISLDSIEIDWKEVNMILIRNKIKLPTSVVIPLTDTCNIRRIIKREPLPFSYNAKARKDMVSPIGKRYILTQT